MSGDPECTCEGGWLGDRCEEQDLCYVVSCQNGGHCESGRCVCPVADTSSCAFNPSSSTRAATCLTLTPGSQTWANHRCSDQEQECSVPGYGGERCETQCCSTYCKMLSRLLMGPEDKTMATAAARGLCKLIRKTGDAKIAALAQRVFSAEHNRVD